MLTCVHVGTRFTRASQQTQRFVPRPPLHPAHPPPPASPTCRESGAQQELPGLFHLHGVWVSICASLLVEVVFRTEK